MNMMMSSLYYIIYLNSFSFFLLLFFFSQANGKTEGQHMKFERELEKYVCNINIPKWQMECRYEIHRNYISELNGTQQTGKREKKCEEKKKRK